MTTPPTASRRDQLVGAKFTALVGDRVSSGEPPVGIGVGVAMLRGDTAWVMLDGATERGIGPALAWALRKGATRLVVLADTGVGALARRAQAFDFPIEVLAISGRDLDSVTPEPLATEAAVPAAHLAFAATIEAAGAVPVDEFGVLMGEVAGLEVCRVVDDANTGLARLDVGVGAHDRETFQMMHAERPVAEALRDVVVYVEQLRAPGVPAHPLNRLAASRLLRARLMADPSALDLEALLPAAPPTPRLNLKDEVPCAARTPDGSTVVVCSTGIDLDAVVFAADATLRHGAQRCLVVVPPRDLVDIQHRLAALVRIPTQLVAAPLAHVSA